MAEQSTSPAPWLMEELIKEILLRLPPQEPASLFRAALVCKPWRNLVSSPRFRRRFRGFHRRRPPMLGFLCDHHGKASTSKRTTPSCPPLHAVRSPWRPLDARHGRVLLREPTRNLLAVWDPVADDRQKLPAPPRRAASCTAAVLCVSALCAGGDHHDCHLGGPFLVVFVGTDPWNMFVCTYDSSEYSAAWSEPIFVQHPNDSYIYAGYSPAVLVRNQLYFGIALTNTALQYDLELRQISWIQLPTLHYCYQRSVLTTMEDCLGLVSLLYGHQLSLWLRMDTPEAKANAGWTQVKAIDLLLWRHVDYVFLRDAFVVGFADGLDIVFVTVNGVLCTVDLKTCVVKKVYSGRSIHAVFPYLRFCGPALEVACLDEEPSAIWI